MPDLGPGNWRCRYPLPSAYKPRSPCLIWDQQTDTLGTLYHRLTNLGRCAWSGTRQLTLSVPFTIGLQTLVAVPDLGPANWHSRYPLPSAYKPWSPCLVWDQSTGITAICYPWLTNLSLQCQLFYPAQTEQFLLGFFWFAPPLNWSCWVFSALRVSVSRYLWVQTDSYLQNSLWKRHYFSTVNFCDTFSAEIKWNLFSFFSLVMNISTFSMNLLHTKVCLFLIILPHIFFQVNNKSDQTWTSLKSSGSWR